MICMHATTKRYSAKWILWAILCIVITLTIGFWTLIAMQMSWTMSMTVTSALHAMGLVLMFFRPRAACALIIAVFAVTCAIPDDYAAMQNWGFEFALAYSAYLYKPWVSMLCCNGALAGVWSSFFLHQTPALSCLSNSTLYLLTYIAGLLFKLFRLQTTNKEKELQMQALVEKMNYAQRNANLARALHDSITAELTSIAILSQTMASDSHSQDFSNALNIINTQANKALGDVHESIASLLSNESSDKSPQSKTLQSITQEGDQYLYQLGFKGESTIIPKNTYIPLSDSIADIFKELYSNIARHCIPQRDEYNLCVIVNAKTLQIIQSNTVPEEDNHTFHSGYGLRMLRRTIASMKGIITTTKDDKEWTITIQIPLTEEKTLDITSR